VVTRLLIADDQALVRGALAVLLNLEPDLDVVAQVGSGPQIVPAARRSGAEVCLIDIEMPGMDGITATAQVRSELPGVRVLIVTTFGIYPLTIFGPEGLLFLCFVFPLGFVAYLPTTALLDRVAEVPLPAWLVWASPLMGWVLFPLSLVLFHRMSRHYQSPGA